EACEGEIHIALAGLGLESVLIRHHEVAQMVHHVVEDVGGNDAVTPQCLLPLCPRGCHLCASSPWHADMGCSLEAIDTTICYVTQTGVKEEDTVGVGTRPAILYFFSVAGQREAICMCLGVPGDMTTQMHMCDR